VLGKHHRTQLDLIGCTCSETSVQAPPLFPSEDWATDNEGTRENPRSRVFHIIPLHKVPTAFWRACISDCFPVPHICSPLLPAR